MLRPFFLALCACLSLASCGGISAGLQDKDANPAIKNTKPGNGFMVIAGDSLAAGVGATDWNNIPAGCFSGAFQNQHADLSRAGSTSEQLLAKVKDIINLRPKLVFLSAGGNDAITDRIYPGTYPRQKTLDEMKEVFKQLTDAGAVVIYLGLNPPTPGAERLPQVAKLARQAGVIVVDGMAGLWRDKSTMHDQVHPNDKGYQIMCKRILAAVGGHFP